METLFTALKSPGLCLEATYLTVPDCLEKLFALLTLR